MANAAIDVMSTVTVIVYSLIVIVGTIGNGLVIYVTGFRMKKSVNSTLFLNLALADFIFTFFLIFTTISASRQKEWPFGDFMCKFNNFISAFSMFTSIFLLMVISLDRCLCVWVVVWAHNKRTVTKARIVTVLVWVIAAICSAPYASFREVRGNGKVSCVYASNTPTMILNIFRFCAGFILPFMVICASNVAICVRAHRLHGPRRNKSNRVIFSIIFAFFICWLPLHVIIMIGNNKSLRNFLKIGQPVAIMLAFANSCLNPVLYVFMCDEFRKKLKLSVFHVLESALADDHQSRSLSSHFSLTSRRSESALPPLERQDIGTETDAFPNV